MGVEYTPLTEQEKVLFDLKGYLSLPLGS